IEHYDHGYLITGNTDVGAGDFQGWLVKTDINGQLLWDKQIISFSPDQVLLCKSLYDQHGNIYVFGLLHQTLPHEFPFIAKLNACGELQWCRLFAIEGSEYGGIEDALFLDNGDLYCMALMPDIPPVDEFIMAFRITPEGECLWFKHYASHENHPNFSTRLGSSINKFGDLYIITGYVYSPYPNGNPNHVNFRPMFIGIDEEFEEQWVVEFGIQDSLLGKAASCVAINDTLFMGVGRYRFVENGSMDKKAWLMFFNHKGEEVGYKILDDEQFGPEVLETCLYEVEHIEGDRYLITAGYLYDEVDDYIMGEMVVDTAGNVYNYALREYTRGGGDYIVKTFDGKYATSTTYRSPSMGLSDIYHSKLNENLQQDTIYPGNYTYDSLCRHTIQSGVIDLAGCNVITSIGEIPTLEEYRKGLESIRIKASPNPSNTGEVLLELENTETLPPSVPPEGGMGPSLQIFNVMGKKVHEERIYRHQGAARINVSQWPSGMYIATIISNGQVKGKCKVLVNN
nr:T9SS type A sorting domain-containing protein [Bacteroidota bacterium]